MSRPNHRFQKKPGCNYDWLSIGILIKKFNCKRCDLSVQPLLNESHKYLESIGYDLDYLIFERKLFQEIYDDMLKMGQLSGCCFSYGETAPNYCNIHGDRKDFSTEFEEGKLIEYEEGAFNRLYGV